MKTLSAVFFALALAVPALAQDDTASIQNSFGYANLSFPNLITGQVGRHSGFVNQTDLNLTKHFGFDNYMGIYSVGQGVTLLSDFVGGKIMMPREKFTPYALAGLGGGYFSASTGAATSFATRYGGGVTIPINDSIAWRVEYSRLNFHLQTTPDSAWTSGNNFAAGIVFKVN